MSSSKHEKYALWVITPNGIKIAQKITDGLNGDSDVFVSDKISKADRRFATFQSLSETVTNSFNKYDGHIICLWPQKWLVITIAAATVFLMAIDAPACQADDELYALNLYTGRLTSNHWEEFFAPGSDLDFENSYLLA